ncbi:uncharacterized protein N0V89_004606 [Didymosphaeria variabile]|uniref:GDP/GTP exchange factor Sec2 N-terminal domain-containing protein n=1 Tax=Didymosphaeria variabile TaxID=1932322 RepID=A0A9W8XS50_9PLEO|nr:uncharacterized protein N0V89_004606 [Didymosphaeria variabile]KAJ4356571.1 hypothetical protein N0V89_004606 [Didymosphaeria variabile]
MAATLLDEPPAPSITAKRMQRSSCLSCGAEMDMSEAEEAQKRIRDLESQVELLTEKATAAVDKCADYEDQLRGFKAQNGLLRTDTQDSLQPHRTSNEEARPTTANSASARQSRFSFLRRGSPNPPIPFTSHSPSRSTDTGLLEQLEKERGLRAKAEERARKVDSEIEELSVTLFSQANEMVAQERKARAKLEARVELLEKKDKDKMARLERLEKAVSRIDRVKAMLAPVPTAAQRKN